MVRREDEAKGAIDLPGRAGNEFDTSLDAALESAITGVEELLLVVIGFW